MFFSGLPVRFAACAGALRRPPHANRGDGHQPTTKPPPHFLGWVLEQGRVHDGALYDAMLRAMNTLDSMHYRGQVAERLLRR